MTNKILVGIISTVAAICLASTVWAQPVPQGCDKICKAACHHHHPTYNYLAVKPQICSFQKSSGADGSGNHVATLNIACKCISDDSPTNPTVNITLSTSASFTSTAN